MRLERWRWRDWPWAAKLGILLVLLAIFPLIVVTLASDVGARRQTLADAHARNLQRARATAALLDRQLADATADVALVAVMPQTIAMLEQPGQPAPREALQGILAHMQRTTERETLLVMDVTGTIVSATDPALIGSSRISTPFFLSAIAGQTRAHDPRYLEADDRVHVHASAPVQDARGRIIGVAAARTSLAPIDRLIAADWNFGGLGEFGMLWDEKGIVISSPARPGDRFRPLAPLVPFTRDAMIAERRFGPQTATLLSGQALGESLLQHSRWLLYDERANPHIDVNLGDGLLRVTTVAMHDRRWIYAIATPDASLLQAVRVHSDRNFIVAAVTAFLAFLFAVGATRWVARPLHQISETAMALAGGDMSRRVRLARQDEFGRMARAFDMMADAIAQKDAELRRHADSLELRVQQRTAELRGLLKAIPDLIFKVDRDGRLLEYVPSRDADPAVASSEFLGQRLSDVMPPEVSRPAMDAVARVLSGESVATFEYRLDLRGERHHYEARISAAGVDAAVVLVRDITSRRRTEERAKFLARAGALLSSSLDYGNTVDSLTRLATPFLADLCVVDLVRHGRFECVAVTAASAEQETVMRDLRARFPIQLSSTHPVASALRDGPMIAYEVPLETLRANSFPREYTDALAALQPTSAIFVPLIARGQRLGVITFAMTVSGRRHEQADMAVAAELAHRAAIAIDNARLYREVEESSRLKDEFLGVVSHELRTPLNAVLGWIQVLRTTGVDSAQAGRAMDAIDRNARAQAQLVEDLLDTSRVVSGKLRIEVAATDVRSIVTGAVESFAPLARARGVTLETSIDDVGLIPADSARLQQVVGNLMTNALKFTPSAGRIHVSLRQTASDVEIRVSDTGIGIAPEFLPYVFDRFRQADSTTTRAHGGLGIGLAIARHIVELHGGTIRAESAGENGGATFVVLLPAAPIRSDEPAPAAPEVAPPMLAGLRVLAVDDEPDACELLRTVLSNAGADVTTVSSAAEAREQMAARRPDLLIADIGMPGEDGYALIRRLRHEEIASGQSRMPAVALTAYARDEDRARSLGAGFDIHLSKPVDYTVLLNAIADLTIA